MAPCLGAWFVCQCQCVRTWPRGIVDAKQFFAVMLIDAKELFPLQLPGLEYSWAHLMQYHVCNPNRPTVRLLPARPQNVI